MWERLYTFHYVIDCSGGEETAEYSADLMDMVSGLKNGDKLYLGAILVYHN